MSLIPVLAPRHEEPQHDVPVHFQVRERSFPVGVERFGVAVGEEAVGEVFFVYVHQPEYGDDECKVAEQVCFVLAAQHEPRGEDGIMDDEDNEIGGYLPPCDEYVFETDVQFRHHLRIEHRHQDDGCPHHYVEQVFSDGLFAGHFHAVKIIKKVTRCSRVAFVKKQVTELLVTPHCWNGFSDYEEFGIENPSGYLLSLYVCVYLFSSDGLYK